MVCVLRVDIFTSTVDASSHTLNFCDMGWVFFQLCTIFMPFNDIQFHHLQILKVYVTFPPTCNQKISGEGEEILLIKKIFNVKHYFYFNI